MIFLILRCQNPHSSYLSHTRTHTLRTHVGESYLTNSLLHQLKRGWRGGRKCSTCFSHLVSELNNQPPPLLLLRLLPLPPPICCCCCGICVGQEKFCGLAAFTLTAFFFSLSLSRCTACRNTSSHSGAERECDYSLFFSPSAHP